MKQLFLFWYVISLIYLPTDFGQKKADGCTIGVASGKATADGRPLLWKNLDESYCPREVIYFGDGRFKNLAMARARGCALHFRPNTSLSSPRYSGLVSSFIIPER